MSDVNIKFENAVNIDINIRENKDDDIISVKSSEIRPKDNKDLRCAPTKNFENGSCIPLYLLVEMANAYNQDNPDNKIKLSSTLETLNPVKYKRYLVKQFKTRLSNVCDNQRCWVKQKFVKRLKNRMREELEKDTFRPKGPQGKFTWLNTSDIDQVMSQYETKYKDYKFLGAVPIDFDDLPAYGIKDLNFNELLDKGISKIGIIFNLDRHDQPGSHWVSLFSDLKKGLVYFSDSYGIEPEDRILTLMRRIARFIRDELGINPIVDYNKMRHQRGGSECGLFSISFILRMLKGDSFEEINKKRIPDSEINECRKYYFT